MDLAFKAIYLDNFLQSRLQIGDIASQPVLLVLDFPSNLFHLRFVPLDGLELLLSIGIRNVGVDFNDVEIVLRYPGYFLRNIAVFALISPESRRVLYMLESCDELV